MCRKLPAAETGHMIALPFFQPAGQDILELARVVGGGGPFRHLKMRVQHIVHIRQHQRRALEDILRGRDAQLPVRPSHRREGFLGGRLALDLVAADAGEADGLQHVDGIDVIPQPRMPENRLDQPPGRRGRDDVVAHPLRFQLRTAEKGVGAPHLHLDAIAHSLSPRFSTFLSRSAAPGGPPLPGPLPLAVIFAPRLFSPVFRAPLRRPGTIRCLANFLNSML